MNLKIPTIGYLLMASIALNIAQWGFYGSLKNANDWLKNERYAQEQKAENCQASVIECRNISVQYNQFLQALEEVGSIPYNANYANCYDHSKLLQKSLAKRGIESSIMVNEGRKHAWLAVWVEATTGHFISPENAYNPILEVRDSKLNVICEK